MGNVTVATIAKNHRERLQIELSEFKGHNLLGLRIYADNGVDWIATTKGISVKVSMLPAIIAALTEAEATARREGLLE